MTSSQRAPTTSRTMDVLVAINVLIATQQGLEDAYVVAQQATPKAAAKSTAGAKARAKSKGKPKPKTAPKKGANAAWAEGIDQGTTVPLKNWMRMQHLP